MAKYIYDKETGKRYEIRDEKDDVHGGVGVGFLLLVAFPALFAPGMIITSFLDPTLNSTSSAWGWIVIPSVILFLLIWFFYYKIIPNHGPLLWTLITYIILTALSIWYLLSYKNIYFKELYELLLSFLSSSQDGFNGAN